MKKSEIILLSLLSIFFISTLYLLYLQFYKSRSTSNVVPVSPVPTSIPTNNPVSGWQTYTDETLGFSFKHPSDFFKRISRVEVFDNPNQLNPKQFSDNWVKKSKTDELCPGCYQVLNESDYVVGTKVGLLQEIDSHPAGRSIQFLISHKNKMIMLRLNSAGDPDIPIPENIKTEFLQILSTFEFTP